MRRVEELPVGVTSFPVLKNPERLLIDQPRLDGDVSGDSVAPSRADQTTSNKLHFHDAVCHPLRYKSLSRFKIFDKKTSDYLITAFADFLISCYFAQSVIFGSS